MIILLFSLKLTSFNNMSLFEARVTWIEVRVKPEPGHTNHEPITLKYSGAYIGGVHLFPFRTEKLSPPEPMVLQ